jgi:hypothetical protein
MDQGQRVLFTSIGKKSTISVVDYPDRPKQHEIHGGYFFLVSNRYTSQRCILSDAIKECIQRSDEGEF